MNRLFMMFTAFLICLLLSSCAPSSTTTIAAQDIQPVTFVVMGDNRPTNPFKPEQPYVYHKIVNTAVELNPEIILNTGDIIFGYNAFNKEIARQEFDDFEKATSPIREKNIPLYITMGNHSGATEFSRVEFTQRYKDSETERLYYSKDIGNCHFIVLSSELVGEQAQITGQQFEWLEHDLNTADGKHIFVLVHRPLYPKIKHFKDSLNAHPKKRDLLATLFKQHDVDMVFVGHVHVYNYSVMDGLGQIIAGGSGAPLAGSLAEGGFNHFFQVIVTGDDVDYRLLPIENETLIATGLLQKDQPEAALGMAKIAIQTVPGHPVPVIIATVSNQLLGQQQESRKSALELEKILGSKENALFRLGEYSLSINQLDLADKYLSEALTLDKNDFNSIYSYSQLKLVQEQYATALNSYNRALSLTKNPFYIKAINKKIREINTHL